MTIITDIAPPEHLNPQAALTPERWERYQLRQGIHQAKGWRIYLSADGEQVVVLNERDGFVLAEHVRSLDG